MQDMSCKYMFETMRSFRESLIEHARLAGVGPAQIGKETGVSIGKLNKLFQRRVESTSVEDAVKVAKYFGQTLESFCDGAETPENIKILSYLAKLSADEKRMLEAQLEAAAAAKVRSAS